MKTYQADQPKFAKAFAHLTQKALPALAISVAAAVSLALPVVAHAEGEVNIYNWSDYIAPDQVDNFSKKYNVKTRYDNFDSNETLHAKMVAGGTGYDVVVPTVDFANIQINGGLLLPLDKSKIPNLSHLDPVLMSKIAALDPDNKYLVPWAWGYTTLGINVDKVKAALGGMPMPANEWDLLFDPKYVSKLSSCGVSVLDSPTEMIPIALYYQETRDNNPTKKDNYEAVATLLSSIRPSITLFSSSGYINEVANGSVCLAMGWSGDLSIASRRAKEAKNGQIIKVLVPSKGSIVFYDTMAIPKDAKNVDNAYKWINDYLEPKVSASMTNTVFYANPNKDSLPFVQKDIAEDKAVFLSPADLNKMVSKGRITSEQRRLQTRVYTKFKSGV